MNTTRLVRPSTNSKMVDSDTRVYISVIGVLLGILVLVTILLAFMIWYKQRQSTLSRRMSLRRKKPQLKLNMKGIVKTTPDAPSEVYKILSSIDETPEFTLPSSPAIERPLSRDSLKAPQRMPSPKSWPSMEVESSVTTGFALQPPSISRRPTPPSPDVFTSHENSSMFVHSPSFPRKSRPSIPKLSLTDDSNKTLSSPLLDEESPRNQLPTDVVEEPKRKTSDYTSSKMSDQTPRKISFSSETKSPEQSTRRKISFPGRKKSASDKHLSASERKLSMSDRKASISDRKSSASGQSPRKASTSELRTPEHSPTLRRNSVVDLKTPENSPTIKSKKSSTDIFGQDTSPTRKASMPFVSSIAKGRSASIPTDARAGRIGKSANLLWKAAIGKTAAANLLAAPVRHRREKTVGKKTFSFSPNGKVKFCVKYNEMSTELFVKVLDLVDLPLTKAMGMSFPYVKVFLYPDNSDQNDPDALFEVLNFSRENTCDFGGLTLDQFRSSILKFVVLDYDRFSRTEFVAECVVPLVDVNMDGEIESRHLDVRIDDTSQDRGSLLVSLCYQPNTSQVSIIVLKAMGLPELEGGSHPDTFVKITLIREGVIRDKRRTKVAKKSIYPVFNEKLVFPVDEQGLRSVCLVFDIIRYESRLKQEKIGNVVIGNNYAQRGTSPHELQHFHETLDNPQKQIAEWHKIIP